MENKNSSEELKVLLNKERALVDERIESVLDEMGDLPMYHMLRYFMGYENFLQKPLEGTHGKRMRPALLLLISRMFGGGKSALNLAVSLELFHNFTLIHDDIVDNDELRRGQPTVWKLWGVDHALNAGDAQALLANKCLLRAFYDDQENGGAGVLLLNKYFSEVVEGQYLDFELTKKSLTDPDVTEDAYVEMIRKKTAVLVGAASSVGACSAGCSQDVIDSLYVYGESLGLAYQLYDDYVSVWGTEKKTGKRAYGDIYERKKTYPLLYTRTHGDKEKIINFYESENHFTNDEVLEIKDVFEKTGAHDATLKLSRSYVEKAKNTIEQLELPKNNRDILKVFVETLVPVLGVGGEKI